jgi:hypothetical protein
MRLNNWHVLKDSQGMRYYLYGQPDSDMDIECLQDTIEVIFDDWSSMDFAEILSKEFQNQNLHSLASLPFDVLDSMKRSNIMESQCKMAMKQLFYKYLV